MKINSVEGRSLGIARINLKELVLVDGEPTEVKNTFHLVLDFQALAIAQEKTGLDFLDPENWKRLTNANLLTLCWCAFRRFHRDVSLERVGEMLSPADQWIVWQMLIDLAFPGVLKEIEKTLENTYAADKPTGEPGPVAEIAKS